MDRNTSNEPGYRPLGEAPAPQMPFGESDCLGAGSRQVLARMPNLSQIDPDTDPIDNYSYSGENRVISSGTSVKILAGIFVGICVLAVLGVFLTGGKATNESATASTTQPAGWQPQPPAPGAEQAPQWGAAPGGSNWQAGAGTPPNSWNNTAPANGWNGQPAPVASGSTNGTPQGPSAPAPTGSWGNPTELTATPSQPVGPEWGQMQEATASAAASSSPWSPPAPTQAWNASPTPVAVDVQAKSTAWPAPTASSTGMGATQTAYADPRPASAIPERSGMTPGYGGAYQPVQPAPAYANGYGQSQAGANQSMSLGGSPATPSTSLGGPSANPPTNPTAAAWQQGASGYRPNTGLQPDPRYNSGTSNSAVQTPYYQAVTPSTSTNSYYTADTRSSSTPNYNAGLPNSGYSGNAPGYPAATGQPGYAPATPPGSQPSGYPASGYPINTGSPVNSGYPTSTPYPANSGSATNGGYSANPGYSANNGYSASGVAAGYPSANPAHNFSSPNYPVAAVPVGAPPVPQTGMGTAAAPSSGAQFQGTIEKPSVQANYDRTRPSLY